MVNYLSEQQWLHESIIIFGSVFYMLICWKRRGAAKNKAFGGLERKETAAPVWVVWFSGQWHGSLSQMIYHTIVECEVLLPIALAWDKDWKDSVLKMFYGHHDEEWVCAQYVFLFPSPLQTKLEDGFHSICFCVICFLFIC